MIFLTDEDDGNNITVERGGGVGWGEVVGVVAVVAVGVGVF